MANRKISDLAELLSPANGDFLEIYDVSEGAAVDQNKKIQFQNLISGFLKVSTSDTITGLFNFAPTGQSVPFTTTKTGVVTNLNADLLDGNHASAFETAFSKNTAFNKNFGTGAGTVCQGNDSRLSDARTPTTHDNSKHSATYITAASVTYGTLNTNGSVGTGATQVARGNHTHANYLTTNGTAYDSSRLGGVPAAGYLRSNVNDTFTGTTLTIGVGSHLLSKEDIRSEKDVIAFYT